MILTSFASHPSPTWHKVLLLKVKNPFALKSTLSAASCSENCCKVSSSFISLSPLFSSNLSWCKKNAMFVYSVLADDEDVKMTTSDTSGGKQSSREATYSRVVETWWKPKIEIKCRWWQDERRIRLHSTSAIHLRKKESKCPCDALTYTQYMSIIRKVNLLVVVVSSESPYLRLIKPARWWTRYESRFMRVSSLQSFRVLRSTSAILVCFIWTKFCWISTAQQRIKSIFDTTTKSYAFMKTSDGRVR